MKNLTNPSIFENIFEYAWQNFLTAVLNKDGSVTLLDDDYEKKSTYTLLSDGDKVYVVNDGRIIETVNIDEDDMESTTNYIAYIIINHFLSTGND